MNGRIEVQLAFGRLAQTAVYDNPASVTPGGPMRLAVGVNASPLPSGHYAWSMAVVEHYGARTVTTNFTGSQDIRTSSSAGCRALARVPGSGAEGAR